jgi:hypothetical protein
MKQRCESARDGRHGIAGTVISRRRAMGSSGLAALGLLSRSALGQEKEVDRTDSPPQVPRQMQERIEQSRAFAERMRNARSMEERMQIMAEQRAWERRRAVENLKEQLGIPDREWPVLKPRIETVYDFVHPQPPIAPGRARSPTEVGLRTRDLQELLREEKAPVDQIKAKLTALRAAREKAAQELSKARQSLRQLMTVRQEAVLVLNGLLD